MRLKLFLEQLKIKHYVMMLLALAILLASSIAADFWYKKYYLPGNAPPDRERILKLALSKLSPEELARLTAEAERKGEENIRNADKRFGHALDIWLNCDRNALQRRGGKLSADEHICYIADQVTLTALYGPPSVKSGQAYLVEGLVEPCMQQAQTKREAIRIGCQPSDDWK